MRSPKPWYRKSNRTWYVQIDGKQVPLGADKTAAIDEFHKLMLKRGQGVPLYAGHGRFEGPGIGPGAGIA